MHKDLPRGRLFTRLVIAMAATKVNRIGADVLEHVRQRWAADVDTVTMVKGLVDSARTTDGWGANLYTEAGVEFFDLVNRQTIVGRMAGLRQMPFKIRTVGITTGATAHWHKQGAPKPATRLSLGQATLSPLSIAALTVISQELSLSEDPAAEDFIQRDLIRATVEAIDVAFIDPANAGVADTTPASVTYGATQVAATGDPVADIKALIAAFPGDLATSYFVTDPDTATAIAMARDSGGGFLFPDIGPRGGSLLTIPVLASASSPADSSGGSLALVDAAGIGYGEGKIQIKTSTTGSVQLSDDPATDATGVEVSLWQTNCMGILVERDVNWNVARAGSVVILTGVNY